MNTTLAAKLPEKEIDAIDAFLECTTYCRLDDQDNDCRAICMERHLQANYF